MSQLMRVYLALAGRTRGRPVGAFQSFGSFGIGGGSGILARRSGIGSPRWMLSSCRISFLRIDEIAVERSRSARVEERRESRRAVAVPGRSGSR